MQILPGAQGLVVSLQSFVAQTNCTIVGVGVTVGVNVPVGVNVGVNTPVGVAVGVGVEVTIPVGVGVAVGISVGTGVAVGVGVSVGTLAMVVFSDLAALPVLPVQYASDAPFAQLL